MSTPSERIARLERIVLKLAEALKDAESLDISEECQEIDFDLKACGQR